MSATEYRAQFDAVVTFANGGGLRTEGFRIDGLRVFAEPHKGTWGGPSDRPAAPQTGHRRIVDLSHPIRDGLITCPGSPGPELRPYLTREQSREQYAPGTEFQIDTVTMVGNTGTYLDSPFHRYADGADLAGLPLESCADYATDAPYLAEAAARWPAEHGARLVGIDSVNVDDLQGGGHRPAHSILLRAGIPVVEHLTGLGQLPPTGFWFAAAPVPVEGFGTFPVRAYATVPG
jgi:kynurenine formamidase